jgi:uncharacterized ion transporter superfamily protein YfcC
MAWNPRNNRILLFILAVAVFVYGLITFQWMLMIIAIVLIALAFVVLDMLRWIEDRTEQFVADLTALKDEVAAVGQDVRAIREELEAKKLP